MDARPQSAPLFRAGPGFSNMTQVSRSCGSQLALSELEKALNYAATSTDGALSPSSADCSVSASFEIGDLPDLMSGNIDNNIVQGTTGSSHSLSVSRNIKRSKRSENIAVESKAAALVLPASSAWGSMVWPSGVSTARLSAHLHAPSSSSSTIDGSKDASVVTRKSRRVDTDGTSILSESEMSDTQEEMKDLAARMAQRAGRKRSIADAQSDAITPQSTCSTADESASVSSFVLGQSVLGACGSDTCDGSCESSVS